MKCKNCGFGNRKDVNFCEECGQLLNEEINPICPSCGFNNRKGVKFCEECGTALPSKPPTKPKFIRKKPRTEKPESSPTLAPDPVGLQPAPFTPVKEVHHDPKNRWILLILAGALIAVALCCIGFVLLPKPLPDDETILPSAVDQIWEKTVSRREAAVETGGVTGTIIEAVENVIPEPVQHVIASAVETIVGVKTDAGKGEKADAADGGKAEEANNADDDARNEGGGFSACDAHQISVCTDFGGKIIENPYNFEKEEMCLCAGETYNQDWCEREGGKWSPVFNACSLINICYDLDPEPRDENGRLDEELSDKAILEAEKRGWIGQYCGNQVKTEDGDFKSYCACPNLEWLPKSCGPLDETIHTISKIMCDENDVVCKVSFSQRGGFPENEIKHEDSQLPAAVSIEERWTGLIQFDNGEFINLHDCKRNSSNTTVTCGGFDMDNLRESANSGKIYLCRGYCCVLAGEEDLAEVATIRNLSSGDEEVCNRSKFVMETIPDHSVYCGGESFKKSWTVWNKGTCTWTKDYTYALTQGASMGGIRSIRMPKEVKPGETITLNINFTAPSSIGTHTGRWEFFDAQGTSFGWYSVVVDVADCNAPEPPPQPECPSGQSMCNGSCCSTGYCCTCNGVLGCYQDCGSSACS